MRPQQLHKRQMTFVRCKRQRTLAEVVQRSYAGATLDQHGADLRVPFEGGQHQESPAESVRCVRVELRRDRLFKGGNLASLYRAMCLVEGHAVERSAHRWRPLRDS